MTIRLACSEGRASLVFDDRLADVARASGDRFSADPMDALARWDELRDWAAGRGAGAAEAPVDESKLGPCVPRPSKVFGVGLNYRAHAEEAGLELPKQPMIFTKFPSCLAGPRADVVLTSDRVDWEVELVVAIGRRGSRIPEDRAFDHVAGYTAGQDISDRRLQFSDKPPQFNMGKSADTFGPIGPALVGLDAFPDRDDVGLDCDVSGERMQESRTSDLIFGVAELVAFLSRYCTLEPGDLIFTGTPSGVGAVRKPPRYLAAGDTITSHVEHVGTLVNRCVAP